MNQESNPKCLVIYGSPGCGKTTRMLGLLKEEQQNYGESNVCFISFTRAGANEAVKRTGSDGRHIRTLHSMVYMLNEANSNNMVNRKSLSAFARRTGFKFSDSEANDQNEGMEVGDQYMSLYALSQSTLTAWQDTYANSTRPGDWAEFDFFCRAYESWKKSNCYSDFGDLLVDYCNNPKPHGYKVMFIDEAQDLSPLQWKVIDEMIAIGGVDKVYVAGDDDQAIFEWAGANPHGMDEFKVKYGADIEVLEQSHRIPLKVHLLAHSVLTNIRKRQKKVYNPRGEEGILHQTSNFYNVVIKSDESTMILCRSNAIKKEVESHLIDMRVLYTNGSGAPSPYHSKIGKAVAVFQKYSTCDIADIHPDEIELVYNAATESSRKMIDEGRIGLVISQGWRRHLYIRSANLIDYYLDVDLVNNKPNLVVGTIHSAKGGEADHVILLTAITPRIDREMMESVSKSDAEHRVWYVAVTRAKKKLTLVDDSLEGGNIFYNIDASKGNIV